ncbi:NADP-dependent oxidoreductase [Microbacterium sp. BWT-B31]|uniref:quinone oxidoreductase family protein n=1 Tax=Microbacterium sp. BWT-B31 TaxID=3232072 RepID=UPI003528EDB1
MPHAIVYTEFGAPEVLTLVEIEAPPPGPGEVAVAVEAVGVNPIDGKLRSRVRPSPDITAPRRIGTDAAGVVTALGEGVEGLRVGDLVAVFGAPGAYATDLVVPASHAHRLPPLVTAAEGAAIGVPVGTGYQALRSLDVGTGDTLLVHGGSGAVGQAIIQFATLWGAKAIATSSARRAGRVRALGATPVAYGPGLADRVRALALHGVTVAIDAAGTDEALDVSALLVTDRARVATLVRGADASARGIRAFGGGSPEPLTPQQLAWRAEAMPVVLALLAAGRFSIEIGPTLRLAEAAEAHRLLEQGGVDGKIVLVP